MFEVTKENYHEFLTYHGMNVEVAYSVVKMWYNTENYHNIKSVQIWVDASRFLLREVQV
jgi:hypothetical protein